MSVSMNEYRYCPICTKSNNCANAKSHPSGACWCSQQKFPKEIFDLLPANELGKTCICENCLAQFTSRC